MSFTGSIIQFPLIRKLHSLSSDPSFLIMCALIMLAVYVIDVMTPLGVPVWLLYFIPLLLSYWSNKYYAIPTVCIVTLMFLAAGFIFSPQGVPVSDALLNRFVFSIIFIALSVMLWNVRGQQIRSETLQ